MAPRLVFDRDNDPMPGTNHDADDSARTPIERIEKRVDDLRLRKEWTPEEIEALVSMIALWRGFKALGFLFGSVKQILIWIGVFAAGVIALRSGLLDWLGIGAK